MRRRRGLLLFLLPLPALLAWVWLSAEEDATAGKSVYLRECAKCHGPSGRGDGPLAATLSPRPADLTDPARVSRFSAELLEKVVTEGGAAGGLSPQMPAFKGILSPSEVKEVLGYIRSLRGGAAP